MQQGDRARGVAARAHFAAIAVEDAHSKIGALARLEQDYLIAPYPLPSIRQRSGGLRSQFGKRIAPRVEHDEIVAEAVHFGEGYAHDRRRV